jgi:tetratricopeptide (TPR) repeat protein
MKNIITLVFLLSITISGNAQMEKVTSAYDYLRKKDYAKAKDRIDIATENTSSNTRAKTWFYRGQIYFSIATSENPNIKALDINSFSKAREAYLKAKELDAKGKYTDEITKMVKGIQDQLLNNGIIEYRNAHEKRKANIADPAVKEGFKAAISAFTTYLTWLPEDTNALILRASCSDIIGEKDDAFLDLKGCITLGKKDKHVYEMIFNILKQKEDWERAIEYMEKASTIWPNNEFFLTNKIVSYDRAGRLNDVVSKLEAKNKENPNNVKGQYLLGYTCSQLYNNKSLNKADREVYAKKATDAYMAVIKNDENHNRAYSDLAVVYYNLGVQKSKESGDAWKDATLSSKLDKESKDYFAHSITHNEKHRSITQNKDRSALEILKNTYGKLNQMDKYKEIKALLN